jgi:hypothetical protein
LSVFGSSTAASTRPAFSLTAIRGESPLPVKEFARTITVAFSFFAASAITDANAWFTNVLSFTVLILRTLIAPYLPRFLKSS